MGEAERMKGRGRTDGWKGGDGRKEQTISRKVVQKETPAGSARWLGRRQASKRRDNRFHSRTRRHTLRRRRRPESAAALTAPLSSPPGIAHDAHRVSSRIPNPCPTLFLSTDYHPCPLAPSCRTVKRRFPVSSLSLLPVCACTLSRPPSCSPYPTSQGSCGIWRWRRGNHR